MVKKGREGRWLQRAVPAVPMVPFPTPPSAAVCAGLLHAGLCAGDVAVNGRDLMSLSAFLRW